MSAKDRLAAEQLFFDRQAQQRALSFLDDEALRFSDDWYLDHESWIRPAMDRLGDVGGLPVLDYGCGHGMAAVVLARRGAQVTAFDLSLGYLSEARRRAAANEVRIDFVRTDAEHLPFADGSFARVWGNAILHHLEVRSAVVELHRVLRPGGIAVFCEPWGGNPLLAWARRHWHHHGRHHTPQEQPLRRRHLRVLRERFPSLQVEGFQFLSMTRHIVRWKLLQSSFEWCDTRLLRVAPALSRFCRYIVVVLRRE